MGEGIWWWVALAALAVVGVAVWMLKGRGRPPVADEPEPRGPQVPAARAVPVVPPPVAPAPVAAPVPVPKAAEPPRAVVPPPRPVVQRSAPPVADPGTPAPKTAATTPVVERAPLRPTLPRVPRFELRDARPEPVLVLARAAQAAWQDATELASTPVQRELLGGLLAQAPQLDDAAPAGGPAWFVVQLRAGTALAVARGEILASALSSVPPQAIDPATTADFAAAVLALHAARRPLPELHAQVGETKAVAATLHPKLIAQTEGRAKSLVQDLARYLREAEENYAGAIRKPVFIERVGHACEQAAALWHGAQTAAANARATLEQQCKAPRFGEVQLERTVSALRELQGQRRVLDVAARLLSGWAQLRLLLGHRDAAVGRTLQQTAASLAAGLDADRALLATLGPCVDAARAPDYVGKAEFVTNRNAARELLGSLGGDTMVGAAAALARAGAELTAGRVDDAPIALLLQLDAEARVVAVREPATSPAAN